MSIWTANIVAKFLDPLIVFEAIRDDLGEIVEFQIIDINQQAADALGVPIENALGIHPVKDVPAFVQDGYFDSYKEILRTGEPQSIEAEFKTEWGDDNYVSAVFNSRALRLDRDHLLVHYYNVSEQKRMEMALRETQERYRKEHELIATLQRSLLPRMPHIQGVELIGRYRPAGQGQVGGDFYDAFLLDDGRWTFVIGDVAGKGPDAAALTSLIRHTIRAYADEEFEIIFKRLQRQFARESNSFCTVLLSKILITNKGAQISSGAAGHLPPLILRVDGSVEEMDTHGTIVGPFEDILVYEAKDLLHPGDLFFSYTDGITEAKVDGEFFGTERLKEFLASFKGKSASFIANQIEEKVIGTGLPRDDIAFIIFKIKEEGYLEDTLQIRTTGGKGAPSKVRQKLIKFLENKISSAHVQDALLLTSEIINNSVLHGEVNERGWIEVDAILKDNNLRIAVRDPGSGFTPEVRPSGPTKEGGRGLFIIEQVAESWGVSKTLPFEFWFELDLKLER